MRLAEHITTEDVQFGPWTKTCTLPAGSHIKIIDTYWLPKDFWDTDWIKSRYTASSCVIAYTQFGLIPIPTKSIYQCY